MINQKTLQKIYDRAYPIGCYYFSNNSTDPGILFGGTWIQIKDCFVKAATSSISQIGGNSQKTIFNFIPSHSHTVTSSHSHFISSHTHSSTSISHSHSVGTHSHSSISRSHSHTITKYTQSPPGTAFHTDDANFYAYVYGGNSIMTFTFSTASQGSGTSGQSAGSTSTNAGYLGSIGYNSSSLSSASISTNSSGSSSGCTINILPPYRECYCWRRTQ